MRVQAYTPVADERCNLLAVSRPLPARVRRPIAKNKNSTAFSKNNKNCRRLIKSTLHMACRLSLRDVAAGGGNLHVQCGQCALTMGSCDLKVWISDGGQGPFVSVSGVLSTPPRPQRRLTLAYLTLPYLSLP